MVYSLMYRRPSYVSSSNVSLDEKRSMDGSIRSGSSGNSTSIPEALSFDRILAGGVCPVCLGPDHMPFTPTTDVLSSPSHAQPVTL